MSSKDGGSARHVAWRAPLLAITLTLLIIAGLGWFLLDSLTSGLCGSSEIARLTSPDGQHDAVLFEHNCGATTDFATHVSVLPVGAVLGNEAGNAFVAAAGDAAPRAAWGGPPVEIVWDADGALAVRYDAAADVMYLAAAVDGVAVRSARSP